MGQDKASICCLVNDATGKNSISFCKILFEKFNINPNYILENYYRDTIDERSLIKLLKKSVIFTRIRWFIPDILALTNENSITDNVLNTAVRYPGTFRNTLLIQLAHMWLTPNLLEVVNNNLITPEAFYKLFYTYATSSSYSPKFFQEFLKNNSRFSNEIIACLEIIKKNGRSIPEDKLLCIHEYMENRK